MGQDELEIIGLSVLKQIAEELKGIREQLTILAKEVKPSSNPDQLRINFGQPQPKGENE